jgi:uncharacterized membrane protein YsdA (DUF1294 family)
MLLFAFLFAVCLAASVMAGKLPAAVPVLYAGASALTFAVYALDKWAARNDSRRTRERTLHILAVTGGWPGALLAQHVLHHKSVKRSFLVLFRITVVLNAAALLGLLMLRSAPPP